MLTFLPVIKFENLTSGNYNSGISEQSSIAW